MTEGQDWALAQLREVEAAGNALEIISIKAPDADGGGVVIELSINCQPFPTQPGGLPLRARERFVVTVPADFPMRPPEVDSVHKRFAEFPHVQWGSHFCLYQAPATEWHPEDGMFGFLDRLEIWLRAGAAGRLDPIGLPLHRPAVYSTRLEVVVPRVDTPAVEPPWWAGYVEIASQTKVAVILGRWYEYNEQIPEVPLAGAILLPGSMPHEYPTTVRALERVLAQRMVSQETLRTIWKLVALRTEPAKPLYFLIGAAMRGVAGAQELRQHLACWYIPSDRADTLREMARRDQQAEGRGAEETFEAWADSAAVEWSPVREARPEIVIPRDSNTPMAWWRNKKVVLLGCGALGSAIGAMIVRAGVASVRLYDNSLVAPGILVRQNFDWGQIGYTKSSSTKVHLVAINPDVSVDCHHVNIIGAIRTKPQDILDCDVIINTTASTGVATALEKLFVDGQARKVPIVSMVIGHRAEYGFATLAASDGVGVTIDLDRRTKITLANTLTAGEFLDEFWPEVHTRNDFFQPEPGCSDPTFIGSSADVNGLSASLLNVTSQWLSVPQPAMNHACVLRAHHVRGRTSQLPLLEFAWPSDTVLTESEKSFQLRIAPNVKRDILGWIRAAERQRGRKKETGGLLFGQIDEFLKIIWVSEVSGPPPDSTFSEDGFICGVAGTNELAAEKEKRTRGAVRFIGMWHTHPDGVPKPSLTDLHAMRSLLQATAHPPRNFLMMILGGHLPENRMEGFLFGRSDFGQ